MTVIGSPCPACGWPLRRAARTMTDQRSCVCTNPDCERYSTKPGVVTRSQLHCPVPNLHPAAGDWHAVISSVRSRDEPRRETGQTTLEGFANV